MTDFLRIVRKSGNRLAHPDILFWVMPFLMLLLVIGTVSQKEIGILASQEKYFSSLFYTLGFVPLPGGMTLITIIFMSLLAKFIFKSEWSWPKSGIILSHFGVLVLIAGSAVSYISSHEGYLTIQEGQSSDVIEDYHQRMVVIRADDKILYQRPFETLANGQVITEGIPFKLTLLKTCYNCGISRRPETDQEGWTVPGQFMQLNLKQSDPQDEKNITGIEFLVEGTKTESDGKYLTFDKFPKPPQIKALETVSHQQKLYTVTVERFKRQLPFSISLEKFKQDLHPGTDMAKGFQSRIRISDERGEWPALIQMNEPLRYRGYTLYQSSFDISGEKPFTVLTVVENKGRIFPYLATLIIAAGLLLHLFIRLKKEREERQ